MSVYGFADREEFDKAREAVRWVRARMAEERGTVQYASPAVTVVIKDSGDLNEEDHGDAPAEAGVYLCVPVYRDFRQTDPDAADAWVEYGPAENHYCEAFGPNKEPLTVGKRYSGRAVGVADVAPYRPRIQVTVGGGGGESDWVTVRLDGMVDEADPCAGYYGRRVVRSKFKEWIDDPASPDKIMPVWPQTDFGPPPAVSFIPVPAWVDKGDLGWDEPGYEDGKYYKEKVKKNSVLLARPSPVQDESEQTDPCDTTENADLDTPAAWEVRPDDTWVRVAIKGFWNGEDATGGYWGHRMLRDKTTASKYEPRYDDGTPENADNKIGPIFRWADRTEEEAGPGLPPLFDSVKGYVGQSVLCRPSFGVRDRDFRHWEAAPWGVQTGWRDDDLSDLKPYFCFPSAIDLSLACKSGVMTIVAEWRYSKAVFTVRGCDLEFKVDTEDCTVLTDEGSSAPPEDWPDPSHVPGGSEGLAARVAPAPGMTRRQTFNLDLRAAADVLRQAGYAVEPPPESGGCCGG